MPTIHTMVIDSHFHYIATIEKDKSAKLPENLVGLEIGLEGGDMEERIKMLGSNRNIFLSTGAGPWVLDRDDFISIENELYLLEEDIKRYSSDAIGEIGFDNHWGYGTKESQRELFYLQAELARKYNLVISIHARESDKELLEAASLGYIDNRTIMHCFSSSKDICKKLLDKGAYISFAGNVTYKNSTTLQESALAVPIDRLLVETDSPYLPPRQKRGSVNNPENTELIIDYLASLKKVDRETLKNEIIENFYKVIGSRESKVKRDITAF